MTANRTTAARWRNDRGPAAAHATLEELRRHVDARSVDDMGAARAWAADRALWMPQRIDADGGLDPTVVAAPFDGEVRIVAQQTPGELAVLCWTPATEGWEQDAEAQAARFATVGTVEGVDPAAAATMWLKRPWTQRAFMSWTDDGRHWRFGTDGLLWKWQGSVQACHDDLEVPKWLRDDDALARFNSACQPLKMRQVHAVAAALRAVRTAQELREHLGAGDAEQRLAARAWAREQPLWSLDGVAASRHWQRSDGTGVQPEHGEVWVATGDRGKLNVGWWDERGDELSGTYEFRVAAELDNVEIAAVASMWIGEHQLEAGAVTAERLEQLWDDVAAEGRPAWWLRDQDAADQVNTRRRSRRRRAGLALSI